jgi:methylenetetrahydrofolate--tRNA-(uracil-5-)-methyltransferase
MGALLDHITKNADKDTFQPMNVNFGLFPEIAPPEGLTKSDLRQWKSARKPRLSARALADLSQWLGNIQRTRYPTGLNAVA